MPLDLVTPIGLLALLALAPIVWLWRTSLAPQVPLRRGLTLALRVAAVSAVALALAGLRVVRESDRVAVIFCLDWSASLDPASKREALDAIERAARPLADARSRGASAGDDVAGLVAFGLEPALEAPPGPSLENREPAAQLDPGATDIGRAIRLAAATFPDDARRRIVIVSDGCENRGDALREAQAAAAAGIEIDAIGVDTAPAGQEVLVESVRAPRRARKGEIIDVDVVIRAREAGKATVRVLRKSGRGDVLLPPREVELHPGLNRVSPSFQDRLDEPDGYVYEVAVECVDDKNTANNRGAALVDVEGETRILYAEGAKGEERYLLGALERAGLHVDVIPPSMLPTAPEDLARYDAVILSDVPATNLSVRQMEAYRDHVRFLGGGLLMCGGVDSFGAGGYYKTPIEEALPLSMEVKNEKHLPSLAIVLCIDKSGSMSETTPTGASKCDIANEGAILTASLLMDRDMIGVVAFDSDAKWVVDLRLCDDLPGISNQIRTIRPGGGTDGYPAMLTAYEVLRTANVQVKHIVMLTDGMMQPANFPELLKKIAAEKMTVSTVGIGADADMPFLEWVAKEGGGKAFFAATGAEVPRILTKDALVVARSLIVRSDAGIPVEVRGASSILRALPGEPPRIYGFVQTTPKDRADILMTTPKDEPLLASWQYGLGRSVAWTPDVKSAWGKDWVRWAGYEPFFAQVVKWIARQKDDAGVRADLVLSGGRGRLVVEALDEAGEPRSFADLRAMIASPDGKGREVSLRQTSPGRYEAEVEATSPGAWFASVFAPGADGSDDSAQRLSHAGAVQSYPAEYKDLEPNMGLLRRLAEKGGGKFALSGEPIDVFRRSGAPVRTFHPLWFPLLAAAAVLLFLDVAARRLVVPEALRNAVARVVAMRKQSAAETESRNAMLDRLKKKKETFRDSFGHAPAEQIVAPPEATPASPPAAPISAPSRPTIDAPSVPPPAATPAPRPDAAEGGSTASKLLEAKRRARKPGNG